MERMRKMLETMAGMMGEHEKEKMEQCFTSLAGQGKDKDRERDGKDKEEPAGSPDRDRAAGCRPESMKEFLDAMRGCFEKKGREGKDGKVEKPDRANCC